MGSIVSRTLSIGQEHELLQKLETAGLTGEDAQRVINSPQNGLAQAVVALLRGIEPRISIHRVTVDRDKTLEDMILLADIGWSELDTLDNCYMVIGAGTVEVDIALVHYDRIITAAAVLEDLDTRGFRPARIEELLALGAAHPDLQEKFEVFALGSVMRHLVAKRYFPYLTSSAGHQCLFVHYIGYDFPSSCRFAAVRK